MNSKNQLVLAEFVGFCEAHPEMRFWQALRNWSGQSFILASSVMDNETVPTFTRDTFYWEGKGPLPSKEDEG